MESPMGKPLEVRLYVILPGILGIGVTSLVQSLKPRGPAYLTDIIPKIRLCKIEEANLLITTSRPPEVKKLMLSGFNGEVIVVGKDCSYEVRDTELLQLFRKKLNMGPYICSITGKKVIC